MKLVYKSNKSFSAELGENTYYVVKYVPKNREVNYYYYDLISELHQLYSDLMKVKVNQTIKDDDFIITKLTDNLDFNEAIKWLKSKGIKTFSNRELPEVTFKTSNPELLTEIVNAIGECGNGGHSFDIVIDPDSTKEEGGNIKFGWDGDGGDYIEVVKNKTFSSAQIPVHKLSDDLAKKLGVDGEFIAVTTVSLIPHDNKMDISFNDQRFKNFEDRVIKDIPEIVKGSSARSNVEKKQLAFIIDSKYKLVKVITVDDIKLSGAVRPISVSFSERLVVDEFPDDPRSEKYSVKYHVKDKSGKESVHKVTIHARDKHGAFNMICNQLDNRMHQRAISDYMVEEPLLLEPTLFSDREKVSKELLEKAKTDGVVQKKPNGSWGIISINAGEWWTPNYETKEKAENALAAYHANKG